MFVALVYSSASTLARREACPLACWERGWCGRYADDTARTRLLVDPWLRFDGSGHWQVNLVGLLLLYYWQIDLVRRRLTSIAPVRIITGRDVIVARWVDPTGGIVAHIAVTIERLGITWLRYDAIRTQEKSQFGIVPAGAIGTQPLAAGQS